MPYRRERILLCNGLLAGAVGERPPTCVLLVDGRIAWIGAGDEAPAADRVIDLQGLRVVPGLTDAHAHLFMRAHELIGLSLGPDASSIAALLEKVRAACASAGPDEWVLSADYSEQFLDERRHPAREELDQVSNGRPVLLRRTGGHLSVANSAALQRAGYDAETPDPPGGTIERIGNRLTGVLTENAADHVAALVPPPGKERTIAAIRSVAAQCASYGIVAVVEPAVGFNIGFEAEWEIWNAIRRQGDFPLRMGFMLRIDGETAKRFDLAPSAIDNRWQVRTLKFFVDGIIGARTAAFSEPYADRDTSGLFMEEPDDVRRKVIDAHADGWQLAAHVIGDRGIDLWLDCLEAAQQRHPRADARHRLEHFAVASAAATARVARLGAVVVPQYAFLHRLGDSFAKAIGPGRAQRLYPGRSLLDAGIRIAGSSDHPIGPLSPFLAMSTAMTRASATGARFNPAESISAEEALAAYTQGSAYAMGHEGFRGRLEVGHAADIAVLDRDILSVAPEATADARSRLTIIDGRVAYSDGTLCPAP